MEFSSGMNVLNVEHVERELRRIAATVTHPEAAQWMLHVARNASLNDTMTPKDRLQNYTVYKPSQPPLDAPTPEELPEWAITALKQKEKLYWFDPIQAHQRTYWKMLEAIANWFSSWPSGDTRLRRITRINFTTAVNAAAMWNKDISKNLWNYVKDHPPVVYRSTDGFYWVRLITTLHFEREDRLMDHCLYKQRIYYASHQQGETAYFSLRDAANAPHVTVEVSLNSKSDPTDCDLLQCKGHSNGRPAHKYQPHITAIIQHMQWFVRGDRNFVDYASQQVIKGKLGKPWPA